VGGEGEEAASLHRRFDAQRLLPKKAARMGDEGKAVGSVLPTALLFLPRDPEVALFLFGIRAASWRATIRGISTPVPIKALKEAAPCKAARLGSVGERWVADQK
jgi:hypothetical protein